MKMLQTPSPRAFLLKWRGDMLDVSLTVEPPRKGRAAFRTNIGHAGVRRREIIAETERGELPLARAWTDIPLAETAPGRFSASIPLEEVGIFSGKACFFPEGCDVPEWPEGENIHVKVESETTRADNTIYTVFPRQFGSFREVARRLPLIMDKMGFRCIQTLPPFPVPTTYAVMGEYGSPFAALDFLSVDGAMAEFDARTTPLGQFRELVDAVHARDGLFFVDLPANHTGWASTLQTHHPEWFDRKADGTFVSPGAWGVVWADLVELDYSHAELRAYMADVFLFWCRLGVDGFRCDAGYMIPVETWSYIVARVREEYPDTVFMLEGLGGDLAVTDRLLAESGLDWAYSELFQTYDRRQFEAYLPGAFSRSETFGTLVHFAETHDNDRLAKKGKTYARLRVQLAALLSAQGAWGIANGVEWYCTEKIDVHRKNDLNWGAADNMVELVARLNALLASDPSFTGAVRLEVVTRGGGNTLAVARGNDCLVLANLDCEKGASVDWDRARFRATRAEDRLTGRRVDATRAVRLAPGEVLFLRDIARPPAVRTAPPALEREAAFHWRYPRDTRRETVAVSGSMLEVSAPAAFRGALVDPRTGKTLRAFRSQPAPAGEGFAASFPVPDYEGDGTGCRVLALKLSVYGPDGAKHVSSMLAIPPPAYAARVQTASSGAEVRRAPFMRTVLSNGAGAAAQIRTGWGGIASQYDAFLAANPDANCPSDRLNVWTRTRCWVQREGYVREVDARCLVRFDADPAGRSARWLFCVPCGMGRTVSLSFEVALAQGFNAARLKVARQVSVRTDDVKGSVRLVFRPDVEWRSFHATTKAYQGAETLFPSSCTVKEDGVEFHPYEATFAFSVKGGVYHHEPQWTYNVSHAEEAARGQDGSGDLFSPGWISADLASGDGMELVGEVSGIGPVRGAAPLRWGEASYEPAGVLPFEPALRRALGLFIVKRDDLKTVIAGYPWFLDWGRDTFIFMRGMIAAGMIADSVAILRAFAAFEEGGTLPNIIYGQTAGNRDTSDAQLFFIRCVRELAEKGAGGVASDLTILRKTCRDIVAHYMTGTDNGIRMDAESGLVWSPSHFTWMDTNYPACTPRTGYPVEIQALWVSALEFVGETTLAEKVRASIRKYFLRPEGGSWDCLAAPHGESAAQAVPEDTVRPNILFLVTLGIVKDPAIVRQAEELLVPGGVRSLNAENPLYKGIYAGDEDTQRKPAYHNGTVWAWPFPLYAEALVATGLATRDQARQLLASAVENLNAGCLCHMSEIADGDAPHAQKGCTAQAWSVSELLRVWLELAPESVQGPDGSRLTVDSRACQPEPAI